MAVKEWVVDTTRDKCDCSQKIPLKQTGYLDTQCASKYCPVCRIGFWLHEIKPTLNQIQDARKKYNNGNIKESDMSYFVLKRIPQPKWATAPETMMLDQLGGKRPWWLTAKQRRYWTAEYIKKYPNSEIAKRYLKESI